MYKLVFLSGLFPSSQYDYIISNSKGVIQYAADALQKSILKGLSEHISGIKVINLPYLGGYPQSFNKPFFYGGNVFHTISKDRNITIDNIGFCNIKGIKHISRYLQTKNALKKWCSANANDTTIVLIYAISTPFLKACSEVKKEYDNLRIVLIVPDLPEYMGGSDAGILKWLKRKNQQILKELYNDIDGYVLLSEHMREKLPVGEKPWSVMEGIYNPVDDITEVKIAENYGKFILYTGTIAKRYGIMNLVHAFDAIQNKTYKLLICGAGDAEPEIKEHTINNSNIIYLGQLPRQKILALQKCATLLVNPRTGEEYFTKYSFPSKTMEYFGSGTPCLIYKLQGIPDEYYEYCYSINGYSINELTGVLSNLMELPEAELRNKGKQARNFILKYKNPVAQAKKILDVIDQLK